MKNIRKATKAEEKELEKRIKKAHDEWNTVEGRQIAYRSGEDGLSHLSLPIEYADGKIFMTDINPLKIDCICALREGDNKGEVVFGVVMGGLVYEVVYKGSNALNRAYEAREWLVHTMMKCYQVNWVKPKMNYPKEHKCSGKCGKKGKK